MHPTLPTSAVRTTSLIDLRPRAVALLLVLVAVAAGCPGRTRRIGGEPPVPSSGDARARQRFEETRARFKRDGATAEDFAAIATEFPDDPIAAHARLYAGEAALAADDEKRAITELRAVVDLPSAAPEVRRRGQFFLGIALGLDGQDEPAIAALVAGKDAVDSTRPDEQASWHAAVAESSARLGRTTDAIRAYDAWHAVAGAAERAYALARIRALVVDLDRGAAGTLFSEIGDRRGPGAAFVGAHLAGLHAKAGDEAAAEDVRGRSAEAQAAFGLVRASGGGGDGGQPNRVGAVLSLSGKRNRVGDASLRGLALAAGAGGTGAGALFPRPFGLEVEDDGSRAAAAGAAVDRLAADGAIAVVGPIDGRAVEAAVERATVVGMPLLSLSPAPELVAANAAVLFHVVHSAEKRARALARHAIAGGVRDFAILRPENRFGEEVARAFAAEVRQGGGDVIVEQAYPATATAFTQQVDRMKKPFQALFVPDGAEKLELIAPALAAANLISRPLGGKAKPGRAILLLSLADGIRPAFGRAAGRYSWGAVVAPGFFPDPSEPGVAEFADAYARAFGSPPRAAEAYAFDAALLVRRAVEAGRRNRGEVADWLATAKVKGLTGEISFDGARRRADDGVLYRVEQIASGQYELRPLR